MLVRDLEQSPPARASGRLSAANSFLWSAALLVAVLWPGRLVGPLDGVPLDAPLEAVLIGLVLPAIWLLHPAFVRTRLAKTLIVVLLAWKAATAAIATQSGWCGEFSTPYPEPGSYRLDRSWDARTYWWPSPPACSAIVARPYEVLADFPAWTTNVTFRWDWLLGRSPMGDLLPAGETHDIEPVRPPSGAYRMVIAGWLHARKAGTLAFDVGRDVRIEGSVDATALPQRRGARVTVPLDDGYHQVNVSLALNGDDWRFVPTWNDRNVFSSALTGLNRPNAFDRALAGWGVYATASIVIALLAAWTFSASRVLQLNVGMAVWLIGAAVTAIVLGATAGDRIIRGAVLLLIAASAVPVARQLRSWRGALLLFGLPWLCLIAARSIPHVGRFTLFSIGDDWLTFQRFAHRIFMGGYWLEGGERTFWYQPLYRWTVGVLHLIFGDSSVGDLYWDAFALLIGALFAFEVASRVAGFRVGILAGTLTLGTIGIGPNWYLLGHGLSEMSAVAWLGLAALSLVKARSGQVRYAVVGGVFAVLAFYTRLNHLPLVVVLVAFAWPESVRAGSLVDMRALWDRLPKRVAAAYLACVAIGVGAFMLRTWYYSGHLGLLAGTAIAQNGTGLNLTMNSLSSPATWRRALESVSMIVTVQDPPRFDPRSLLVVIGVCSSALALMQVPLARRLPLNLALTSIGAVAGGLVARGIAYPGRFSIHLIPLAVTASVLFAATMVRVTAASKEAVH